jgi:hypothetical protein
MKVARATARKDWPMELIRLARGNVLKLERNVFELRLFSVHLGLEI